MKPAWKLVAPHLRRVLVNSPNAAGSPTLLEVWVFDSASSARLAQQADPMLAEHRRHRKITATSTSTSGFVHRQLNVIAVGSYDRWPATVAALAQLAKASR